MDRPTLELAQVIRAAGAGGAGAARTADQRRALREVLRCRTAELGGHVEQCAGCDRVRVAYNSCRNRHCPRCCGSQQARWLAREAQNLLPAEYHHVVFTLPAEVNRIGLANPVTVYEALLGAAEALRVVTADPKHLGAQVGALLVLHTWGQTLSYHPHAHAVVTGGGLAPDGRWRSCRPGFFVPVRVLSRVFRGAFLTRMHAAFTQGKLLGFADGCAFDSWVRALVARDGVVYAKPPLRAVGQPAPGGQVGRVSAVVAGGRVRCGVVGPGAGAGPAVWGVRVRRVGGARAVVSRRTRWTDVPSGGAGGPFVGAGSAVAHRRANTVVGSGPVTGPGGRCAPMVPEQSAHPWRGVGGVVRVTRGGDRGVGNGLPRSSGVGKMCSGAGWERDRSSIAHGRSRRLGSFNPDLCDAARERRTGPRAHPASHRSLFVRPQK
jgi:hypothetical protein